MQISEGLYAFVWDGQGHNCNSYAIRYSVNGSPRYVLIDPGRATVIVPGSFGVAGNGGYEEPGVQSLLKKMAGDGIRPEEVGLVIATHAHGDHCESSIEFQRKGIKVAVHKDDAQKYLSEVAKGYQISNPESEDIRPDMLLTEGKLELGSPAAIHLQIIHAPGHLPGAICVLWEEKKALFCGDTVFHHKVGMTDREGGDPKAMRSSIRKLSGLKVEYLLSGHGHSAVIAGSQEIARNFEFLIDKVLPSL